MDKIKQFFASVKEYFTNLSNTQKIVLFIAVIILICFITSCGECCSSANTESNTDSTVVAVDSLAADTAVVDSVK